MPRGYPVKQNLVHYRGTEMTVAQAIYASQTEISSGTIYSRLKAGWPIERALSHPLGRTKSPVKLRLDKRADHA